MTTPRNLLVGTLASLAIVLAGCSGAGTSPSASTAAPPSVAPTESAAPSEAASESASPAAAAPAVEAKEVGSLGTVLVAGSNGITVYTFSKDVADSGTSACTGTCLTNWPALTVPAATTPTGGPGVTGKLGTITRADDGTFQVTYNGLPLYFFANDKAPGDANGVYTNWNAVKP